MARARRTDYLRTFKFYAVLETVNPPLRFKLGLSAIRWSVRDLIIEKGLLPTGATLYDMVSRCSRVWLVVVDNQGADARQWEVDFTNLINRGCATLDANSSDIARDCCALQEARCFEQHPLQDFSMLQFLDTEQRAEDLTPVAPLAEHEREFP